MGEPALKVQARDFDPTPFITKIGKKDYLTVAGRILWFRHYHPAGVITTSLLSMEPLVVQATVSADGGQVLATGLGSANSGGRQVVWSGREIEKAETAAIGRALAHAGFGTQFVDEDEEHLADSPVELKIQSAKSQQNGTPKMEWPSMPALQFLETYIADKLVGMSRSEIARLAGAGRFDDLEAWKRYENGTAAFNAIEAAFNDELSKTPPAQPKAQTPQPEADDAPAWTDEELWGVVGHLFNARTHFSNWLKKHRKDDGISDDMTLAEAVKYARADKGAQDDGPEDFSNMSEEEVPF